MKSLIEWSIDASNVVVWRQQVLQEQTDDVLDGGLQRKHRAIVYRIENQLGISIEENIADEHVASKRQGKAMLLVDDRRQQLLIID